MFFIWCFGFRSDNSLISFSKVVDFRFELHANFEDLRRRVFVLVVGVHCHGHGSKPMIIFINKSTEFYLIVQKFIKLLTKT